MLDLHEVSRQMLAHQRKMDIARQLKRKWLARPTKATVTDLSRKTNTGIELTLMLGGRRG